MNDTLMQVCCRLAIYRSFLLKLHPRIKSAGAGKSFAGIFSNSCRAFLALCIFVD